MRLSKRLFAEFLGTAGLPVIQVLHEINIDISKNRSKSSNECGKEEYDYVLTVCDNAKENCPYFPAKSKVIHHSFADPANVEGGEKCGLWYFARFAIKYRNISTKLVLRLSVKSKIKKCLIFSRSTKARQAAVQ